MPGSMPQPDGTLIKAVFRATEHSPPRELGLRSRGKLGRQSGGGSILRLALLAPDIVDEILTGRTDQGMMLDQQERPLPASWEEQREHFGW